MTDKSWKVFERWVCKLFGMTRRGVYFDGNDCRRKGSGAGFSVECKLHKTIPLQTIIDAIKQSQENKEHPLDIPVAVLKKKGKPNSEAIAVMFLSDYIDNFVGGSE